MRRIVPFRTKPFRMRYRCEDHCLRGVERAAFQLHCSPRQLQRILNGFVRNGMIRRVGKGSYELV